MSEHRKLFLIVGATGKQGNACIQALLTDNSTPKTLRFLTRNAHSVSSIKLVKQGCSAYEGDLLNSSSLNQALTGVDAAFLVTDFSKGIEAEVQMGRNFIDAAKRAGVKHVVFSSACDADNTPHVPHWTSKWQIEQYLQASGIPFTITRPVAFMDNFPVTPGAKRFIAIGTLFALAQWKPIQFVAVEDIGIVAAQALLSPESEVYKNKRINLSSGEYSYKQILDAYEKVQGKRPWIASLLPSWLVYTLPYDFKQMMLYFRSGGYPKLDVEALRRIHPGLLSFEDWVARKSQK